MRSVVGHLRLALGHAPLDEHGAAHRVDNARELDEGAVAHELDDAALVLGDQGLDELSAVRLEAGEGAVLVPLHEPAVADHVGRQDGGEPPLDPRHRRPPRRIAAEPSGRARRGGRGALQPARRSIDANA